MPVLAEANWVGLNYSVFDAIQSYLVEHPEHYWLAPNKTWLCWLTKEFGLLVLENDFTDLTDEQISAYIFGVLEALYDDDK